MDRRLTRRQSLGTLVAGAAAALAPARLDPVIGRALGAAPKRGRLRDIEHVVILIQENRSFDHYFGSYRGVRGFDDPVGRAAFTQSGFSRLGFEGVLQPFHLRSGGRPQCISDVAHTWGSGHRSWNGGAMDGFVAEHMADDGWHKAPLTMGYYTRQDLGFYYALADAFTICDRYHASVLGPTDPNRLVAMSGTLDPAGRHGGPLLETLDSRRAGYAGRFRWTTMPEQLSARDIEWKLYADPHGSLIDNVLPYFHRFQVDRRLRLRGLRPTYPGDFRTDVRRGTLPAVSWILTRAIFNEHPGFSTPPAGEAVVRDLLATLTSNRRLWAKTVLLLTWDEEGGLFDHVAPPTAPPDTAGEWITTARLPGAAEGIRGPIGLGFRVPLLVISPFSRGGYVCSDVFDHTSILRFLERRFGAEVPNLSGWRRRTTGDLTSAFSFGRPPERAIPRLPAVPLTAREREQGGCVGAPAVVDVPPNGLPHQEPGRPRRPRR